jgi:hypothetical protein
MFLQETNMRWVPASLQTVIDKAKGSGSDRWECAVWTVEIQVQWSQEIRHPWDEAKWVPYIEVSSFQGAIYTENSSLGPYEVSVIHRMSSFRRVTFHSMQFMVFLLDCFEAPVCTVDHIMFLQETKLRWVPTSLQTVKYKANGLAGRQKNTVCDPTVKTFIILSFDAKVLYT